MCKAKLMEMKQASQKSLNICAIKKTELMNLICLRNRGYQTQQFQDTYYIQVHWNIYKN